LILLIFPYTINGRETFSTVSTGGETSEQPGVISNGTYILTSSIVGIVEEKNIIDGAKIKKMILF